MLRYLKSLFCSHIYERVDKTKYGVIKVEIDTPYDIDKYKIWYTKEVCVKCGKETYVKHMKLI